MVVASTTEMIDQLTAAGPNDVASLQIPLRIVTGLGGHARRTIEAACWNQRGAVLPPRIARRGGLIRGKYLVALDGNAKALIPVVDRIRAMTL